MFKKNRKEKGFTLVEMLITFAIIAVLAVIVLTGISPGKLLVDARNNRRKADAENVYSAIEQYIFINNGRLPGSDGQCFDGKLAGEEFDAYECEVFLPVNELPRDPSEGSVIETGYLVKKDDRGRIGVQAFYTEGEGEKIKVGYW